MRKVLKNILFQINLIFIFLLVLSYVSTFVSPRISAWLPFFGLIYPYILVANIIFVIIWLRYKKWKFLFSLIVILIGWNHLGAFFQINKVDKNHTESDFSVMSYNVRLFDLYNWSNNKATKNKILDFLTTEKPDIMCIQEFYYDESGKFKTLESIKKFEHVKYYHAEYTYEVQDIYNFGIATFSKYPIINRGSLSFQNTNNISIYSDIVINDDTIRIYNNHLQSIKLQPENYNYIDSLKFLSNEDERISGIVDIYKRIKEAYIKRAFQVEVITDHIQNSPYPVVIVGDFNDSPFSYTYRRMKENRLDAFIEKGNGIGNTYIRAFPSFRIDYILHSHSIICNYYKKFRIYYSDHYPIMAKFTIQSVNKNE